MLASPSFAPGQCVWLANPSRDPESPPFLSAEVVSANGATAEVTLLGTAEMLTVRESALDLSNAISAGSSERAEPDNCDLLQLSEATLLHNTLLRYNNDEIYTFT